MVYKPFKTSKMKTKLVFLPLLLFMFISCEKEEVDQPEEASITEVLYLSASSRGVAQTIAVTISKPTPCHTISEVKETTEGKTITYDFILSEAGGETACVTMIAEETVEVTFNPSEVGEYTLNFLINGEFRESRTIVVTD